MKQESKSQERTKFKLMSDDYFNVEDFISLQF